MIRAGGGIFYGDGQLGDQQSPVTNTGWSYSLSSATTPNLAYPIYVDPNNLPYGAPSDYDRHRRSEMFQEWTAQVQQASPWGMDRPGRLPGHRGHSPQFQELRERDQSPDRLTASAAASARSAPLAPGETAAISATDVAPAHLPERVVSEVQLFLVSRDQ